MDGDTDGDGDVDSSDLANWAAQFSPSNLIVSTADFDNDQLISGADFMRWQLGVGLVGTATPSDGDANADGDVNASDLAAWEAAFGQIGASLLRFVHTRFSIFEEELKLLVKDSVEANEEADIGDTAWERIGVARLETE